MEEQHLGPVLEKKEREREEEIEKERQRPCSHLLPPITLEEWREHAKLFTPLFDFYRTMKWQIMSL